MEYGTAARQDFWHLMLGSLVLYYLFIRQRTADLTDLWFDLCGSGHRARAGATSDTSGVRPAAAWHHKVCPCTAEPVMHLPHVLCSLTKKAFGRILTSFDHGSRRRQAQMIVQ